MKKKYKGRAGRIAGRIAAVVGVTLLMLIIAFYGVILILTRGPSPTAKKLFVMSVKETSAGGFLADICLPRSEIDRILKEKADAAEKLQDSVMDKDLISVGTPTGVPDTSAAEGDADPAVSDGSQDGVPQSGIEITEVKRGTFNGVMMTVYDPKRVFIGVPDKYGEDCSGLSLKELIEKYGAVGGTNAGGFNDPGGMGTGGIPLGSVIKDGEVIWGDESAQYSMIGFDGDGILHVGTMSGRAALAAGVRDAVSFGPALIINGVPCNAGGSLSGGINPRTAIGQRADGAMLMLVVNGRSIGSLGATLDDLIDVMLSFGAVNAANLDGGASSLMMYGGETMNNSAYVYGERVLPNAVLVK